jgi:queuine tRNA-ribosyltransferase accessory subunit
MDAPEHGRPSKLPDEMLSFSIAKSAGPNTVSPRLGALIIPRRKPIQTPHFLALTSRGAVPHISQDTLRDNTNVKGVYLALEDCEAPLCDGTAEGLLRDAGTDKHPLN